MTVEREVVWRQSPSSDTEVDYTIRRRPVSLDCVRVLSQSSKVTFKEDTFPHRIKTVLYEHRTSHLNDNWANGGFLANIPHLLYFVVPEYKPKTRPKSAPGP
jgi:hypothetical protein